MSDPYIRLNDEQKDYISRRTLRELLEWKACVNPNDELSLLAIDYGLSLHGAELARILRALS